MSGIDQNYSDCVFEDDEKNAIRFVGVEPTNDYIVRKDQVMKLEGVNFMYTGFEPDPDTGKPSMIKYKKILKTDPDTREPTILGEENTLMVKSFFQDKKGRGRMWWTRGGKNKRGRKSKKYSKTKSKSRTRRGGRRSRRVRRIKRKSRR